MKALQNYNYKNTSILTSVLISPTTYLILNILLSGKEGMAEFKAELMSKRRRMRPY
jgi:hypothetical protein